MESYEINDAILNVVLEREFDNICKNAEDSVENLQEAKEEADLRAIWNK